MVIQISSSDAVFCAMAARLCEKFNCTVADSRGDVVIYDVESPGKLWAAGIPVIIATFYPTSSESRITLLRPFTFEQFGAALAAAALLLAKPETERAQTDEDGFSFDADSRTVSAPGLDKVSLTACEFELAKLLFDRAPEPVPREELSRTVFPDSTAANTVDVYINYLRTKFSPYSPIATVRGVGYRWKN